MSARARAFARPRHIAEFVGKAGIEHWPRNGLRHSFVSYHIAHFKDAASFALEMGHTTTGLIFQHCRQVVKQADGARWWALRPSRDDAGKIVNIGTPSEAVAG